jgi:protein translocase SecG subunit
LKSHLRKGKALIYVLYALFFISCVILIGSVLLQPGKTDAGALFTSNVASAAFAPRGTTSVLAKITIVAAAVFMLSALMISMPALTGNVSVLEAAGDEPAETAPTTQATPSQPTAVANVGEDGGVQRVVIPADTNANGALIETPATQSIANNTNSQAPANTGQPNQ